MGQLHLRDQKTIGTEDLLDRTLRWMRENLDGANRAVHPTGHPNEGKPCSNSGTAVIVCCYINALGKVLKKGKGRDNERFKFFVTECMTDFMNAGSTKALPTARGLGAGAGEAWLYHVYRCGVGSWNGEEQNPPSGLHAMKILAAGTDIHAILRLFAQFGGHEYHVALGPADPDFANSPAWPWK